MAKLIIKDLNLFNTYLNAISSLVDSCKFTIDENECTVMSVDDSKVFRVFFRTNVILSDSKVEFCIGELNKFNRSISTLRDFKGDDNQAVINFDGNFLKMKDKIKFSLKLIKEEVIKRMIAAPITAKLEPTHGFKLNNATMKKLCSMTFISTDDTSHRVYLYKEDEKIIGELDNKKINICDSISIPISTDFYGDWTGPVITKLDDFRKWNLLGAPEINIHVIKQGACIILNEINNGDFYAKVKIVCPTVKK
jgi:hypothetical protein